MCDDVLYLETGVTFININLLRPSS